MRKISLMKNSIQEYEWGSKTAIPELLGRAGPAENPQAELWMGAQPKAPSQVYLGGLWRSLLEVIAENPEEVLGRETAHKFSNELPFLFKVLAAAKPLSIQAHPNQGQAREGFLRENQMGIPLGAVNRNYRDVNHKPEIICALTPFWALNGFRQVEEILRLLGEIQVQPLVETLSFLRKHSGRKGLKRFFYQLMNTEKAKQAKIVEEVVAFAEKRTDKEPVWTWIAKLNEAYPGDIGVLSPAFLNLVQLKPQQAMFLSAGELHSYLEGTGIELMANSDNVLRGGLTAKHIDVQELLRILNFTEIKLNILQPQSVASGEAVYPTGTAEFVLSIVEVSGGAPFIGARKRSVEIMICTRGEATITDLGDVETTDLNRGASIIVPAAVEHYRIEGEATLYKAAVPLKQVF
jgi:mannose-6-phosphate isomerase